MPVKLQIQSPTALATSANSRKLDGVLIQDMSATWESAYRDNRLRYETPRKAFGAEHQYF